MKTNKVVFQYQNQIIVSNCVEEVKKWIDTLPGLTCNPHVIKNLECIINTEWVPWGAYNQNISPVLNGYRLECIRTTGISNRKIDFYLTKFNTVEEVLADRAAYAKRINDAKEKVADIENTIGQQLLKILSAKSKSCVELRHRSGLQFVITIGQRGYWYKYSYPTGYYAYLDEYYTHFDGETLITDEGKNLIDILNKFINEN